MPEKLKGGLTAKVVCDALIELKAAAHPHLARPAQFATLADLTNATVMDVLRKKWIPTVEVIEKWTRACGKTMPQFFHDVTADVYTDLEIKRGYEDFYRLLTVIFKSEYPAFVAGIESNLVGLASAVDPEHELVRRYTAVLLKRKTVLKEVEASTGQPLEGPTQARASPGKSRRASRR